MIELTVVVDNRSSREDLAAEHGLCLHIRSGNQTLLFDSGKSDLVLKNLEVLDLEEPAPEWIVLSHGHYDHANGIPALVEKYPEVNLCFHPMAMDPKWILDPGVPWRYGGIPRKMFDLPSAQLQPRRCGMELIPGVMNSGSVLGDFATTAKKGRFFRNRTGELVVDAFPDEQVLFVQTEKGISVISGCMHAGIIATIEKSNAMFPHAPLYALVGGFHLDGKPLGDFAEFVETVAAAGFQKLMPLHCSGDAFIDYVQKHNPNLFLDGKAGTRILL